MKYELDPRLMGGVITDDIIKPKKVEIFYENNIPYLKYTATSTIRVDDEVFPVNIEIPKISLNLSGLINEQGDDMFDSNYGTYVKFEIIACTQFKVCDGGEGEKKEESIESS